jgi:hypothetical protein
MQNSRDLSIWRSLAVAFGDGLAFGVGMKLTQTVANAPVAERQIERAPTAAGGSFDQKVLEAVVNALEARLNEHTAQMERRLAELESRIAVDLRTLQHQAEMLQVRVEQGAAALREEVAETNQEFAQSVGRRMEQDLTAVRQEVLAVNRDFAQSVSRIVADQVGAGTAGLETRFSAELEVLREDAAAANRELVQSMPRVISEQVAFQMEACANALQQSVAARLTAATEERLRLLDQELERKNRELAEIRQRVGATDANMLEFIIAMGRMCRQATERVAGADEGDSAQGGEPPASVSGETPAVPDVEASPELPVPDFAQGKGPTGLWRVPLVSSVIVTVGGLIAMHYL